MSTQETKKEIKTEIENIGGIDNLDLDFDLGVNVIVGENAQNKSSILQGLMLALGSDNATLHTGRDEGRAKLQIGDDVYEGKIKNENGKIVFPDKDINRKEELFAFLTQDNDIRTAIEDDVDLREIFMDPFNIEDRYYEINKKRKEKKNIEKEISKRKEQKNKLKDLEKEEIELQNKLDKKKQEKNELEEKVEEIEKELEDIEEKEREKTEKAKKIERKRQKKKNINNRIQTKKSNIDDLRSELQSIEENLEDIEIGEGKDISVLEKEVRDLEERRERFVEEISEINKRIESIRDLIKDAEEKTEIVPKVECWMCGEEKDINEFKDRVDEKIEERKDKNKKRQEIQKEIQKKKNQIEEIKKKSSEKDQLEHSLDRKTTKIEDEKEDIERLEDKVDSINQDIERLVEDTEDIEIDKEIAQTYRDLESKENEIERLKDDLRKIKRNMASVQEDVQELDRLKENKKEIEDKIQDISEEIKDIDRKVKSRFNTFMAEITRYLGEGLEDIHLNIVEKAGKTQREKLENREYELKIKRSNGRWDNISRLSHSERETIGLLFALSGYLAYDLDIPLIVDNVGMFDSRVLENILEDFGEKCQVVFVTVLPETAGELESEKLNMVHI